MPVLNASSTFSSCGESLNYIICFFVTHPGKCLKLVRRDKRTEIPVTGIWGPLAHACSVHPPSSPRTMHRQAGAVEPGISLPQAHYPNPHTARRSRPRIFMSLSWDFLYSWIRVPGLHLTRYGLQLATHQPCHGAAIP